MEYIIYTDRRFNHYRIAGSIDCIYRSTPPQLADRYC